jgi:polyisoprenoid-binding protein YceI
MMTVRTLSLSALSLGLSLAVAAPVAAAPAAWTLDADHSTVGFAVRHMMVTDQKGAFDTFTGTVDIDDADITKSTINVEIDVASINMRSPEFFDVAKFPKITFVSQKIEKQKDGSLKVLGNLTMRGITKPITLNVAPLSDALKDPWGGLHRGTTATTTLNREDFGLTWNKTIEKGGVVVGKDVKIELQLELLPKKAG